MRAQQFVNEDLDYGAVRKRSLMVTQVGSGGTRDGVGRDGARAQVPRSMGLAQLAPLLGADVADLFISQPDAQRDFLRVAYVECKDEEQKASEHSCVRVCS